MSLIEKALQKIQAASQPSTPSKGLKDLALSNRELVQDKNQGNHLQETSVSVSLENLPTLQIDKSILRKYGMLAQQDQERVLVRQFREIKRSLLSMLNESDEFEQAGDQKVIMLSSALSGDGKTFTALNLASSLAMERDLNVILVDGDVAKPHISSLLDCSDKLGLLDFIADTSVSINEIIYSTNISGLYFVPAGKKTEQANELMSGQRMKDVLSQLSGISKNTLLLFDTSPILLTSESKVMASYANFVLLLVRSGVTPKLAVTDSIKTLQEIGVRFGIVLNDTKSNVFTSYGYGYGYGYGDTYGYGAKQ